MGTRYVQSAATKRLKHLAFVYGTLKTGQPNHHVLRSIGAVFVGDARTLDKFPLIVGTRAKLPFLLHHRGHGQQVSGELYLLTDQMLELLDEFEEHPYIYEREPVPVEFEITNCELKDVRTVVERMSIAAGSGFSATAMGYFFKEFPADQLHRRSLLCEYNAAEHDGYGIEEDEFRNSAHVAEHLLCEAC